MSTLLKMQVARGKFYYRMFKFFLLTLPLTLIVSLFFILSFRNTLEREFNTDYAHVVSALALQVDEELAEIDHFCRLLTRVMNTQQFTRNRMTREELLRGHGITLKNNMELINHLVAAKASVEGLSVHFTVNGFFISNYAFMWESAFFTYNQYAHMTMQDYMRTVTDAAAYSVQPPDTLSRPYANLVGEPVVPIIYTYKKEGLPINVQLNVRVRYFDNLLADAKRDPNAFLAIYDAWGSAVAGTGGALAALSSEEVRLHAARENGTPVEIGSAHYTLFGAQSSYARWTVLAFVPRAELMERYYSVMRLMALVNGLILTLGILMSYGFSRRLYSPIAGLIALLDDTTASKQRTGKSDELALVATRIKWLENTNRHLAGRMSRLGPYVQGNVLRNIVLYGDNSLDEEEILELFQGEKVEMNLKYYVLVLFSLVFTEACHAAFPPGERTQYSGGICVMVKEAILHVFDKCVFVEMNEGGFFGVINGNGGDLRESICRLVAQIGDIFVEETHYVKVLACVGPLVDSLKMLPDAFASAMEALARRDVDAPGHLVEMDQTTELEIRMPPHPENSLQHAIESGNPVVIERLVHGFFQSAFQTGRTAQSLKGATAALYELCANAAAKQNMACDGETWSTLCAMVDLWDLAAIRKFFVDWIATLAGKDCISFQDEAKRREFEAYCAVNYMDECFSLESMAAHFGLHSSYLSRRFKALMGSNFKDYLLNLRMDQAISLLANSDLPIDAVAEQVGIVSRSTFNRLFKKHSGVSPATYRVIAKQ